jgi:hypothetical protein
MKPLLLLSFLLIGCAKVLIDDKPIKKDVICKTCITQTNWYPEGCVAFDSCVVCGDSAIRAVNGWGRTIAAPDLSWGIHKWTYCK